MGMRESEALGLMWDCVDFDAGAGKISKQLRKRKLENGGATLPPLLPGMFMGDISEKMKEDSVARMEAYIKSL